MINPWTEWMRMVWAGTMLGETLTAAHQVVGHRTKTIEAAAQNPLSADYPELIRMVSEKSAAFAASSWSMMRDWVAMQADLGAQASALGKVMMGEMPSPKAAQAMMSRGQRLGSAAVASSIRAMRPVHSAATANARRLSKTK